MGEKKMAISNTFSICHQINILYLKLPVKVKSLNRSGPYLVRFTFIK